MVICKNVFLWFIFHATTSKTFLQMFCAGESVKMFCLAKTFVEVVACRVKR